MKKLLLFTLLPSLLLFGNKAFSQLARGADIGWLTQMEKSGRIWRDGNGIQRDLLDILDDYCINSIRLRVWVNPANGWNGKQDVINIAKRAVAKGYRIMIDFHYSDSWADPGQQTKPAAWTGYNVSQLGQAVYNHTTDVLNGLKAENVTPEWVQVGNETNNGMLWPEGQASTNMANYASFVNKGYEAVKAVFPNTKVIVHVANSFDNALFRWNIGGLISNGAKFDIIGMSMYPDTPQDWQTYAQQALTNMNDMISRYNKEIMVSEIGVSVSAPTEARLFVEQVIKNLQSLSNKKGLGIFWWEPEAYNWQGYVKVAWNSGTGNAAYQATDAMNGFKLGCENKAPIVALTTSAGNGAVCQGTSVMLTANASDADGNISKVEFYDGANLLFSDNSTPFTYLWANPSTGVHALSAKAFDNLNASATSTSANLTVNTNPEVTLTAPLNNSTIESTNGFTSVTLNTQTSGPALSKIEFYNGSSLIGSTQTNTYTWNQVADGSYSNITAVATSTNGCKGTSSPVSFVVSTVTGLTDNSKKLNILIFPNPSHSGFTIELSDATSVEIYNYHGQLVDGFEVMNKASFGDEYKPGIYWIRLKDKLKPIQIIKY